MQQMSRAAIFRLPGSFIQSKYVRSARIVKRVLAHAVDRDLPVQMRAGGVAGRADITDRLALGDLLAGGDRDGTHVAIERGDAVAMVDDDTVAITGHSAGRDDRAAVGRNDARAIARADVHTGVILLRVIDRVVAPAELRRDRMAGRARPHHGAGGAVVLARIIAGVVFLVRLFLAAQILDLLREMQDRVGASIIMITHDLGVVAEVSDKVAVMYAGRKVEEGSVEQILFNPQHPYTKALKGCIPHLQRTPTSGRHRLHEIPGMVLGMAELGKDRCSFYERCPCGKPECMEHNPPAKAIDAGHEVACWLYS